MVVRKPKRTHKDVDEDIRRYKELLKRDIGTDIPPKRCRVKVEYEPEVEIKREEPEPKAVIAFRQTRSVTRRMAENPPMPRVSKPVETEPRQITRPLFKSIGNKSHKKGNKENQKNIAESQKVQNKNKNLTVPIPLENITKFAKLEDKVSFDNSYAGMIKLVNDNLDRDPRKSTIDIALHHRLISKNLVAEKEKLELKPDCYSDFYHKNALNVTSFFNSSDIDSFFEALSGFESQRELIRDKLKREIPLV